MSWMIPGQLLERMSRGAGRYTLRTARTSFPGVLKGSAISYHTIPRRKKRWGRTVLLAQVTGIARAVSGRSIVHLPLLLQPILLSSHRAATGPVGWSCFAVRRERPSRPTRECGRRLMAKLRTNLRGTDCLSGRGKRI